MPPGAIDCWVNVNMGDYEPPEHLIRVKEDYLARRGRLLPQLHSRGAAAAYGRAGGGQGHCPGVGRRGQPPSVRLRGALSRAVCTGRPSRPPGNDAGVVEVGGHGQASIRWRWPGWCRSGWMFRPATPVYYPPVRQVHRAGICRCRSNTGIPGPPMPGEGQDPMLARPDMPALSRS